MFPVRIRIRHRGYRNGRRRSNNQEQDRSIDAIDKSSPQRQCVEGIVFRGYKRMDGIHARCKTTKNRF